MERQQRQCSNHSSDDSVVRVGGLVEGFPINDAQAPLRWCWCPSHVKSFYVEGQCIHGMLFALSPAFTFLRKAIGLLPINKAWLPEAVTCEALEGGNVRTHILPHWTGSSDEPELPTQPLRPLPSASGVMAFLFEKIFHNKKCGTQIPHTETLSGTRCGPNIQSNLADGDPCSGNLSKLLLRENGGQVTFERCSFETVNAIIQVGRVDFLFNSSSSSRRHSLRVNVWKCAIRTPRVPSISINAFFDPLMNGEERRLGGAEHPLLGKMLMPSASLVNSDFHDPRVKIF